MWAENSNSNRNVQNFHSPGKYAYEEGYTTNAVRNASLKAQSVVANITLKGGPSVVVFHVIKMHEYIELGGWGGGRTSRHTASHSVGVVQLLQDEQSNNRGSVLRRGREICCERRTDWCWPKLFSRYLPPPPRRCSGRVVKLTTTLHTLTLRISAANLHASRLHGG